MENKLVSSFSDISSTNSTPVNPSPVSLPKQTKPNAVALILLTILLSAVIFGFGGYYLGKQSSNLHQTAINVQEQVIPTPTTQPLISPAKQQEPSKTATLPHEYLPGFNITNSDWKIEMKQFRDREPRDFVSTYFPTCHERCMGVRLSKSDVSLDMLFDVAFDSNPYKCSNSATYKQISNGWYRVKDNKGYFYTRNVELNKTLENGKFPSPFGKVSDEWSAVADNTYKICVQGSGDFLDQYSKVEAGETGEGVPLLMEFPKINGNPDDNNLIVFDNIVSSIKGLSK